MVTSSEFDEVLVPVDYQNNVLMRTFDTLIGFNKKNKKGKFMKAIKEEWENGHWVEKTEAQKRSEARSKEIQDKIKNGTIKVINLDAKKSKSKPAVTATAKKQKTAEEKAKENELYKGHLINKVGKTNAQIQKELRDRINGKVRDEFKEPGDTHYTIKELVSIVYPRSEKTRKAFPSEKTFRDALLADEALRKSWDEKVIKVKGHKPEKKTRKVTTAAEKAKAAELETDIYKITDWFWNNRKDRTFIETLGNDVKSWQQTFRRIKNDERGLKYFANLMDLAGYKKEKEKPFVSKVTVIKKKNDAPAESEKEGEAAKDFEGKDSDAVWDAVKSFFTSWAKECGYKLTPEALKKFKENVYKTIVYYNTMHILKGDK